MDKETIRLLKIKLENELLTEVEKEQNKWNDNGQLFYVGGAVRDEFLNEFKKDTDKIKEIKDIDIATNLTPGHMKEICAKMGIQTIDTGIKHGTVTMMIPVGDERIPVEVTTFRKDVDTDGRNATVEYARTIEEDLSRRDFKFNAMAISLKTKELLDPFKGLNDLKQNTISFVGDAKDRIMEDHLRMIRFIRFSFQLGFPIDKFYFEEIKSHFNINILSKERIKMEMDKIVDKLKFKNLKMLKHLFDKEILLKDELFNIFNFKNINPFELSLINKYISDDNAEIKRMFKYSLMFKELDEKIIVQKLKFSSDEFNMIKQVKMMKQIFDEENNSKIAIKKMINKEINKELIEVFLNLEDKRELVLHKNSSNQFSNLYNKIIMDKEPCHIKDLQITAENIENFLKDNLKEKFKKEYIGKSRKFLIEEIIKTPNKNNEKDSKELIKTFLMKEGVINNNQMISNDEVELS